MITDRGLETSQARYRDHGELNKILADGEIVSFVHHFATGQLRCARRLFASRECPVFQAVFETAVSDRVDHPQFQGAGRTCRQQDGFQPATRDRRVRAGRRSTFARDCATDVSGFKSASVRVGPSVRARSGTPVCRRPACACDSWRCSLVATRTETSRHRFAATISFQVFRSASLKLRRNARSCKKHMTRWRRVAVSSSIKSPTN